MSTPRSFRSQTSTIVVLASEDLPPLIQACLEGDQELLQELLKDPQLDLEQRAEVEIRDRYPNLRFGRRAGVEERGRIPRLRFGRRRAEVEERSRILKGVTALFCASLIGHHNVVKVLADHGADVNCKSQRDETPLSIALSWNNLDVVKVLIEKGSDVNCTIQKNWKPLSGACVIGSLEIVKYLVENGADVNCKGNFGTALHVACMLRWPEISIYLIDNGADVNCKADGDQGDCTPLHRVCSNGDLKVVKYLIKNGADIDCRLLRIESPLHKACLNGHLEVVKYLIESGADVNLIKSDESPLYAACALRRYEIAKHLIDKGADLNFQQQCHNGITCLIKCCCKRLVEVSSLLLQKGADPNVKDHQGCTALYYAMRNEDLESVKLLLKYNASVNFKAGGMTPLHIVIQRIGYWTKRVNERTRNERTRLISILQQLLEHGAYPVAMDHKGLTPLDMLRHSLSPLCCDDKETVREILRPYLPVRLMSLAAQCIRKHGVSYSGLVPGRIAEFIELH